MHISIRRNRVAITKSSAVRSLIRCDRPRDTNYQNARERKGKICKTKFHFRSQKETRKQETQHLYENGDQVFARNFRWLNFNLILHTCVRLCVCVCVCVSQVRAKRKCFLTCESEWVWVWACEFCTCVLQFVCLRVHLCEVLEEGGGYLRPRGTRVGRPLHDRVLVAHRPHPTGCIVQRQKHLARIGHWRNRRVTHLLQTISKQLHV
jgi:hypothetical protein